MKNKKTTYNQYIINVGRDIATAEKVITEGPEIEYV